jgi:S1-C subfamily serine protease
LFQGSHNDPKTLLSPLTKYFDRRGIDRFSGWRLCAPASQPEHESSATGGAGANYSQRQDLQRLSTTFADIARKVTPAVVNIQSQKIIPGRTLRDPFFGEFFGDEGPMFREPDRKAQSLGSGVLVDTRRRDRHQQSRGGRSQHHYSDAF